MNLAVITGRIANAPEIYTTKGGTTRATFRLAVQRTYKDSDGKHETDFLPVVCWRGTAEFVNKYLDKGRKVAVKGNIQTRTYDAQDGSKRTVTEIIAENVEPLDSRKEGFTEVEDDELPFD